MIDNLDKVRRFGPNNDYLDFRNAGAHKFPKGSKGLKKLANGVDQFTVELPRSQWKLGREAHFAYLNKKYFNGVQPEGMVWHHMPYNGEMQLVPRGVHTALNHRGGMAPGRWGWEG